MKKINNKEKLEDKATYAVAAYLESIGWKCMVGGFKSIEQGYGKFNFRLVFNFVGGKK